MRERHHRRHAGGAGLGRRRLSACGGRWWPPGSGGACSRAAFCTRASIHLGSNMLALFFIGARSSRRSGRCGWGSSTSSRSRWPRSASSSRDPHALSIGASARSSGSMGAFVIIARARVASASWTAVSDPDPSQPGDHVHYPGNLRGGLLGGLMAGRRSRASWSSSISAGTPARDPAPFVASAGRHVRGAAHRRRRARALEVPERGLTADAFRMLAGPVIRRAEERGSRFLAIAEPVLDRPGAEALFAAEGRAHRNPTHVVPPSGCVTAPTFSSDAGEPAGSAGARSWPPSPAPACTTSPPSSCAGTAARTSASAASCEPTAARSPRRSRAPPTVRGERAAEALRALRPRADGRGHALRHDARRPRAGARLRRERGGAALPRPARALRRARAPACATRRAAPWHASASASP